MALLEGRTAVVTGAGRGLGRSHALMLAKQGARVVVNDLGAGTDGIGADAGPAHEVVEEIRAFGGDAIVNSGNVAGWDEARSLVATAIEEFGDLHVVVNNAGILRDRMLVNMSEEDWDAVLGVHLKGTFAVSRWAATYWRDEAKRGAPRRAAIINTSSVSGRHGIVGQTNYGAAKAGIVTLSLVAAAELGRYGVRVNVVCPAARTRLTTGSPGTSAAVAATADDVWDALDPANVSPLVAYLASESCTLTGQVYGLMGGRLSTYRGWTEADAIERDSPWDVSDLRDALEKLPTDLNPLLSG